MPCGRWPTRIVAVTWFVRGSIFATAPASASATQTAPAPVAIAAGPLTDADRLRDQVRLRIDARHRVVALVGHPHRPRAAGDRRRVGPGRTSLVRRPTLGSIRMTRSRSDRWPRATRSPGPRPRSGQRPAPRHPRPPGDGVVVDPHQPVRAVRRRPDRVSPARRGRSLRPRWPSSGARARRPPPARRRRLRGTDRPRARDHVQDRAGLLAVAPGGVEPDVLRRRRDVAGHAAAGRRPAEPPWSRGACASRRRCARASRCSG